MGRIFPSKCSLRHTFGLGLALCTALLGLPVSPAMAQDQSILPSCTFITVNNASAQSLNVGYFLFPPYSSNADDGTASGSWPDYIRELLGRSGIRYTDAIYPAKRLASKLFSGEVDLTIVADNILLTAGEEKITYLPKPLVSLKSGLVSLRTSPVRTIESLRGKTLGVNRGYGYGGLIHELMEPTLNLKLWPAESELQLMKLLIGRRMPAAIMYESILRQPPPNWNIDTSKLYFETLNDTNFFITLNKQTDNIQQIQRVLTHSMTRIDEHSNLIPCP